MVESLRLDYYGCRQVLLERLAEPAPGRIQLLTGPRQVGKTTLLLELAEVLGDRALYAAADSPEWTAPGAWERLWAEAEDLADDKGRATVFLDEVHLFSGWSVRLKGEWDRIRRRKIPVQVVATGSSSLRMGAGSRESLAGRFERITLAHWSAAGLAKAFEISLDAAALEVVCHGSYPGAFSLKRDSRRRLAYVRDAIVEPAIGRDILAQGPIRKPALLRQVFGVCVSAPAQIVSLQKIQGQLQDRGALETVAHYLALLEDAFLVACLAKYSKREARQRSSPPKLVTLNNALLSAGSFADIPDRKTDPARFGSWVENACLAYAWNCGQSVRYWRQQPYEVDGVLEGSWGRWAMEVKTGTVERVGVLGLLEFTRQHPEFRALVVCDPKSVRAAARFGIEAMSWEEFLNSGPKQQR